MEMAKILAGMAALMCAAAPVLGAQPSVKEFPDVPRDHWAAQAVRMLAEQGIIIGYPDGTFGGAKPLTRYEFAESGSRLVDSIDQRVGRAIAAAPGTAGAPAPAAGKLQNYYTRSEVDTKLQGLVTKEQLQRALLGLARKDDVYTRQQMDDRFATKDDVRKLQSDVEQLNTGLNAISPTPKP